MTALRHWLVGRKTYLLAGALALATLALLVAGRLNAHSALPLLLLAAFGFPATFRAAMSRHQDEVVELLDELAETAAAVASHNLPGALAAGEAMAKQGEAIAEECQKEAQTS